jgi:hypothetical protein
MPVYLQKKTASNLHLTDNLWGHQTEGFWNVGREQSSLGNRCARVLGGGGTQINDVVLFPASKAIF